VRKRPNVQPLTGRERRRLRPVEENERPDHLSNECRHQGNRNAIVPQDGEVQSKARMIDIASWLAELGLGHHAEAFRENGIAGDVLRDLSDADLKALGLNLVDRKRLLKAIAALSDAPVAARSKEVPHWRPRARPSAVS
jgi:SAM domain (Sterile alpha motif)